MQHVAHRASDEIAQLKDRIEQLTKAIEGALELLADTDLDGEDRANNAMLCLTLASKKITPHERG